MSESDLMLKPAEGVVVRDPTSYQRMEEAGAVVPASIYWQRRLADGDVVPVSAEDGDPEQRLEG